MEAAVKRTTPTAHPSDANMDPEGARKRLWFNEMCIFIEAPEEGMSTCRSEDSEDSESKRHKDKETQEVRVLNMPEASPGFGGGLSRQVDLKQKMGNKETTRKMKYDGWRRR